MAGNDKVPELTNGEFFEFISEGLVVVDFFAEWCMPCVMMGPVIEELSDKFEGKVKFGKVNVENDQELAQKFGVTSIPNITIMRDGKILEQSVGAISEEEFEDKLNRYL